MLEGVFGAALRHRRRFFVALLCLALLYVLLSFLSYDSSELSWSHYTTKSSTQNLGGVFGSKLFDILHFAFGALAWGLPVLMIFEALTVAYGSGRIVLPLRLMSYMFLWVLAAVCASALGVLWVNDAKVGGVVGSELFVAFSAMGAQLVLFICAAMLVWVLYLMFDFSKPKTAKTVKTLPALDDGVFDSHTIYKPKTLNPKYNQTPTGSLFENFLQNSGLKDELLKAAQKAQEQSNTQATPKPELKPSDDVPSATGVLTTTQSLAKTVNDKTKTVVQHTSDTQEGGDKWLGQPVPPSTPQGGNTKPKEQDTIFAGFVPPTPKGSHAMQTAAYRDSLTPIPSLRLLDQVAAQSVSYSDHELSKLSELLQIKLKEFGVSARVVNVMQGPIVTSFEVELAAGVKASKVTGIAKDLARSLSMASLRVVEVIAGKSSIGIEIPNQSKQTVKLFELLHSPAFQSDEHGLAVAMGKDIMGRAVITDLAKAPHMLVAGTTGSGKSVLVNTLLLSLLLKYTPKQLRLILIDPKMLELAPYNDIGHLLTPVVTDMAEAASALSWCVGEMERRYQLMALLKVRKISEFNKKVQEAERKGEPLLDPLWRPNDSAIADKPAKLKPLPLIVVVADEFADMMMQVGKQAEELITRLAQKSRAAGIHLVLATQRPSVDVITGLIKANIPVRAALRVNSRVDSRTILDAGGAEDMLGHGDMLFLGPGKNEPMRVHGAYVTDEEVNRVCDAWRERGKPEYIDTVTSALNFPDGSSKGRDGLDDLYDEALAFVMESGKTSISSLQRKLSIGYNRAANIIESMQEQGILSAPDHAGKRTLLL